MKILSFSLCLLIIFTLIAGCSDSGTGTGETNTSTTLSQSDTGPAETSIYDNLPKGNYNGYDFTILNSESNFAFTAMSVEELTGEALYDAIYERNSLISEALNINITEVVLNWDEIPKAIREQVMSGDHVYDIFCNEVHLLVPFAEEQMFVDAGTVTTIDLDMPWWNQPAMESLKIGNKLNFLYGDLHFMLYECYFPIAFNKSLIADMSLDDLYEVVENQEWTLEKMNSYMRVASMDINGDGIRDIEDQFGLGMYQHNTLSFYHASDMSLIEKGADNIPVYNGLSEKLTTTFTKISEQIFADKNLYFSDGSPRFGSLENGVHTHFNNGNILFYIEPLGSLKKFRDVDFEIGVIPLPKFDASQEDYRSYIYHGASAVTIPITNNNLDMTGTILEHMAAESHRSVMPVYFNVTLAFKYIQDEASQKMLDIMFSNGQFELSRVYNWGSYANSVIDCTVKTPDKWSSNLAKFDESLPLAIEKSVDLLTN